MKLKIKYLLIGLITGILFATAGSAFAADAIERITAQLRHDFKLELDGEKVELENTPILYKERTYLPVRELADYLGLDVDFEDGTVKLDTPKEDVDLGNDFISLKDLVEQYDVVIIVGAKTKIGGLEFETPTLSPDESIIIETDQGSFEFKNIDFRNYVRISEMQALGVIQ